MSLKVVKPPAGGPYFSQWSSAAVNEAIIDGDLVPVADRDWAASGATSAQEYDFWSWHACGVACTQGVLARTGYEVPLLVPLAREIYSAGGYRATDRGLLGLIYAPYVQYLHSRWGLDARVAAPCSVADVCDFVDTGGLAVASVHPSIRYAPAMPPGRGGHLVLVTGARGGLISFDNPSGVCASTWRVDGMERSVFGQYFAERAILINSPDAR